MIKFGRSIRWYNDYESEIAFSKENGFDFIQVWFKDGDIQLDNVNSPKEKVILDKGFPVIIHALFELDDFDKYSDELLRILKYLGHNEVIIHPVCQHDRINSKSIYILDDHIKKTSQLFEHEGITLFIENNSRLDPVNYSPDELKITFGKNPNIELLLDIAHIDSYEDLQKIIDIKYPKCLHIADKHFSVVHEHLPIGFGDLDFNLIFKKYLSGYDGKIIFEVITDDDETIITGKNYIKDIFDGLSSNE